MSYTIEYNQKAFIIPKGTEMKSWSSHTRDYVVSEDTYHLFIQQGCNNVEPRPRTWHLAADGWSYRIIQEVCQRAGDTEGGMIKMNGRDTSPEAYLKKYRALLAGASPLTIENLKSDIAIYSGSILIGSKDRDKSFIESRIKEMGQYFTYQGKRWEYENYEITINSFETYMQFAEYKGLGATTGGYVSIGSYDNK